MIDVLILCGGFGTRFNINKKKINKPLVKINGKTILERIIDIYEKKGNCRYIILGGFKFKILKRYIENNFKYKNILILNTGVNTPTGGRIFKAKKFINSNNFCVTYGDSLANFSLKKALKLKKDNNFIISTYKKKSQYGNIIKDSRGIKKISEKKMNENINAGFYIFDKNALKFFKNKKEKLEVDIFNRIFKRKFKFLEYKVSKWKPMDTEGNKIDIENLLKKNKNYFK